MRGHSVEQQLAKDLVVMLCHFLFGFRPLSYPSDRRRRGPSGSDACSIAAKGD